MTSDPPHSRFLSLLSHDLRGAFHTVQLALDMLRGDVVSTQPAEQMLQDIQLGRRAVIDAVVRLERLLVAERLRLGVMPVRPHKLDVVPAIRQAVEHAIAVATADEQPAQRISVQMPATWELETDARLLSEVVGGVLDHALREAPRGRFSITANTEPPGITISADQTWLPESFPTVGEEPQSLDARAVGLFVAVHAAHAIGWELHPQLGAGNGHRLTLQPRA